MILECLIANVIPLPLYFCSLLLPHIEETLQYAAEVRPDLILLVRAMIPDMHGREDKDQS